MNLRFTAAFVLLSCFIFNFVSVGFGQTSQPRRIVSQKADSNSLPKGITRITSLEGITEYRLDNGLQILLMPDQTKQLITTNVIYRVGSRHEGYGETGMAHLLEHLMFRGTPKYTEIRNDFASRGVRSNGGTNFDHTSYYLQFTATDENLEWAIDLEADRMVNSFISKKDLDTEMTVVRNEMERNENSAAGKLSQLVLATAYQWHNYGKLPIGARSDVENVRIENLQAFYKKYYQPDNATLVIGGKFDEAKVLDLVGKKFGAIPKPSRLLDQTWTTEPPQEGEREVTLRRIGNVQTLTVGYHLPAFADPDFPAAMVMLRILADTPGGKLHKALVETKKATNVIARAYQQKEPGYGVFSVNMPKEAPLEPAKKALLETIETFAAEKPGADDVEKQKAAELRVIETSVSDLVNLAMRFGEWVGRGDWRLTLLYRERMKKVTTEDVQRVAQKLLIPTNRTLGILIPTESSPQVAQLPRLTDEEIAAAANGIKESQSVAQGEAFDATPANIEARTKRGQIGGMKTAFLNKKTRGETVTVRMTLRYGDARSLMNRSYAGTLLGQLLLRGTVDKTRQQLQEEFARLKAAVTITGHQTGALAGVNPPGIGVNVTVNTTRQNLAEVIKLVAEVLQKPGFSPIELDQLKTSTISALEGQKTNPSNIVNRESEIGFNRYPKGDVRYVGNIDDEIAVIKAVTLEDLKKFHQDFYGTSNAGMSVVGDFDEKELTETVTKLYANWKSSKPYQPFGWDYFNIPAFNKSFETPGKANASFRARLNLKLRDDSPDYPALMLANYMIGTGVGSRLGTRLREKEGISYQIQSLLRTGSEFEGANWIVLGTLAPENLQRFETGFEEEMQKIAAEGFSENEIAEAKKGWMQARQVERGQDSTIAGRLVNYLFINRTYNWDGDLEKKVESLTAPQINTAVKKYLIPEKISISRAGDFAKTKAGAKSQ